MRLPCVCGGAATKVEHVMMRKFGVPEVLRRVATTLLSIILIINTT
jgi:hypothetical protein